VGIFVIYAVLPASWVATRNDDLIFNQIGWWFPANMILNGIWLPTFQSNTRLGFIFGFIIIIALEVTALVMEQKACAAELNVMEIIFLRCAMSIYAGWVGAASIVSLTILLKNLGIFSANESQDETSDAYVATADKKGCVNEPIWGVTCLWIALVLYGVNVYLNMDPLFGAVLIWACCAIRANTTNSMIRTNLIVIIGIMSVYVGAAFICMLVFKDGDKEQETSAASAASAAVAAKVNF